jgi:hypothetical protein
MEVSSQLHAPAALPPGEIATGTHLIGDRMGSRAGLNAVDKKKFCHAGNRILAVQPAARRYNDYFEYKNIVKDANSQYGCHTARTYFSFILFNISKGLKNADVKEI